jgi:hypothetical protein
MTTIAIDYFLPRVCLIVARLGAGDLDGDLFLPLFLSLEFLSFSSFSTINAFISSIAV